LYLRISVKNAEMTEDSYLLLVTKENLCFLPIAEFQIILLDQHMFTSNGLRTGVYTYTENKFRERM